MNNFFKVCFALALASFIACFVSACVGTFHADNVDWQVDKKEFVDD